MTPNGLCIASQCRSIDELVSSFHPFCEDRSLFVPTSDLRPVGARVRFAIMLTDRSLALCGWCTIESAWNERSPFGPPGMRLHMEQLTVASDRVFAQLTAARRSTGSIPRLVTPIPVRPRTVTIPPLGDRSRTTLPMPPVQRPPAIPPPIPVQARTSSGLHRRTTTAMLPVAIAEGTGEIRRAERPTASINPLAGLPEQAVCEFVETGLTEEVALPELAPEDQKPITTLPRTAGQRVSPDDFEADEATSLYEPVRKKPTLPPPRRPHHTRSIAPPTKPPPPPRSNGTCSTSVLITAAQRTRPRASAHAGMAPITTPPPVAAALPVAASPEPVVDPEPSEPVFVSESEPVLSDAILSESIVVPSASEPIATITTLTPPVVPHGGGTSLPLAPGSGTSLRTQWRPAVLIMMTTALALAAFAYAAL